MSFENLSYKELKKIAMKKKYYMCVFFKSYQEEEEIVFHTKMRELFECRP